MPKKKASHKNRKRQQSSAKNSQRSTENDQLQGSSTDPQTAVEDWEEATPAAFNSDPATGPEDKERREELGAIQDYIPQSKKTEDEILEEMLANLPELTELTLWKISEVIQPQQFLTLGLKLGLTETRIQNLLGRNVCQEEKTFELLYKWYANQGEDPSKILFKILTSQEQQDQEQLFQLFSKETYIPVCTALCGRSFQSFQLYDIAEEVHVDQVIPLGLRLGLKYAKICTIREDSHRRAVSVQYNILMRWQKDQTAQIDQVETLARILEACHEKTIAYKIRNNHFGVTNEGKALIISEDQPEQGIAEIQLSITHPEHQVREEAQSKLQAVLDTGSSELRIEKPLAGAAEFRDEMINSCKHNYDLVKQLEKIMGRDGLYKFMGLTLDSIHFHVKVYTTEGLHWLQRDVQSGHIGHELAKVLISSDTKQQFPEDIVLVVVPEKPDAWDLLSLADEKSNPMKTGAPADSENREGSDGRTPSSSSPSEENINLESTPVMHTVTQQDKNASLTLGRPLQGTTSDDSSVMSHVPPSQRDADVPDDAHEKLPATITERKSAGEERKKMGDWSEDDVMKWLIDEVHLSGELVSKFKGVDGFTLLRYSKPELQEDFELDVGYCRRLLLRRKNYLAKERLGEGRSDGSMPAECKDENSKMSVHLGEPRKKMEDWSEEDVMMWLKEEVHLSDELVSKFKGVDGYTLVKYSKPELQEDFELDVGYCRRLLFRRGEYLREVTTYRFMPSDIKDEDSEMSVHLGEPRKKMEDWSEEEVMIWLKEEVHLSDDLVSKFKGVDGYTMLWYSKPELLEDFELCVGYCRRLFFRRGDYQGEVTTYGSIPAGSEDENSKMSVRENVGIPSPATVGPSTLAASEEVVLSPPSTIQGGKEALPLSTSATLPKTGEVVPLSTPSTLQETVPGSMPTSLEGTEGVIPLLTEATLEESEGVAMSTKATLKEKDGAIPFFPQASLKGSDGVKLSTRETLEKTEEAISSEGVLFTAPLEEAEETVRVVPQNENMLEAMSNSLERDTVFKEVENIDGKSATTTSSRELLGSLHLIERSSPSEDLDLGYTSSNTATTSKPSNVDSELKGPLYQRDEKGGEVVDPSTEKKLTNLLLGSDKGELDSSYYPVLVVNTPPQQLHYAELEDKFGFMASVNWNVVFDCSADSNKVGLCHFVNQTKAIKILNAETFTETKDTDTLREDIDFPEVPVWIFPNGRNDVKGMEKMSDMDWMRWRSNAVLQTVRFFSDPSVIPSGRAVVVFLLLSFSDFMVLTQLFREFYTSRSFQDLRQFTIVAEDQDVLHQLIQHLDSHCIVSNKNMKDRCLGGVKWQDINMYMMGLLGSSQTCLPELPLSPKGQCKLMKKHQSQWSDISIVAKNECENNSMDETNPNFSKFVGDKESRFYRGHEVDWWNFYLSEEKFNGGKGYNHVLKRQNYKRLFSEVRKVLAVLGKKVTHISIVTIFHEAGSGGTTVAKNLLWDLHRDYRCAVVNRVTNDTVNQIVAFQKYGYEDGQNPGPVVILLENVDSESMRPFLMSLEQETRYIENNGLAFVLIHCKRTSEPQRLQTKEESKLCVCIEHKLTEEEKQWFVKKTKDLERRNVFSEKESPEQLLAFMVMKKECDPLYLKNVVKGILPAVGNESKKELQNTVNLLKYIAVVQMYHPGFAMPVSACDSFMQKRFRVLSSGGRQQTYGPWEKDRLPFLNLLLLEEFIHDIDGCVKGLTVVHPIIASEIVKQLGECFQQRPADMVLELIKKSSILDTSSHSKGYIQKVCRDLMVKRLKKEHGDNRETDFSPFIEDVYNEDKAKAFEIMELGIKKFQDPFIAQHKARLHSKRENDFDSAEQAINIALGIVSSSSYLWDTKGIILREKMIRYERKEDQEGIDDCVMKELLDTFNESCKAFQNAQKVMEEETTGRNYAGFVGEIHTISKFLDIVLKSVRPFCHRTGGLEILRRYLMTEYIPPELTLPSLLEFSETMKTLSERVDKALGHFTDYIAQCVPQRFGGATYKIYLEKLEKIYIARNRYFACRKIVDAHAQYPVETAYAMRRAEVKTMNADGYHQIFDLASTNNVKKLTRVKYLLHQNLANPNLFDIKNFVFTVFALAVCTDEGLDEEEARKSVSILKRMEEGTDGFYGLFFEMLLNWPDGTARVGSMPIAETIRQLRYRWSNRYLKNGYDESRHNLPRRCKIRQQSSPLKASTEFYLGLKDEKSRFVHRTYIGRVTYSLWKEDSVKKKLKRLDGDLDSKHYVLYHPEGQEPVKISLSLPIKGLPSKEPVQFYLGFSFSGPLAYDVVYTDNRETPFIAKESLFTYPSYVKELDEMGEGPVSYKP